MARQPPAADDQRVSIGLLAHVVAGAFLFVMLTGSSGTAAARGTACDAGAAGNDGYTYAGHQASHYGHGVRATITLRSAPVVAAGHVSGWVGVGGPGQGANGEDAWIQVGLAAMHGLDPFLYAEIARNGRYPQFVLIENGVQVGERRNLAVLEMARRPGWWRAWVDGKPVTKPVRLRGSTGRWAPIATAESWNGGHVVCNTFGYRFERVSVSYGGGGSWKPFVSAHRFLDAGYQLRALATAPARQGVYGRRLSNTNKPPLPFAFVASS
jgi:hypothetical protein